MQDILLWRYKSKLFEQKGYKIISKLLILIKILVSYGL